MNQEKANLLVKVSQLYFFNNRSQQEIAQVVGVSRPTVSRLLAEARDKGIVHIEIRDPSENVRDLETRLKAKYGLSDCKVSQTFPSSELTISAVGRLGAGLLMQNLRPGLSIGITWGSTIKQVVENAQSIHMPGIRVLQMVGSLGEGEPDVDGHEIARQLAEKFEATYRIISAPPLVNTPAEKESIVQLKTVNKSLNEASKVDICVFGVGSLEDPDSSLHRSGHLSDQERLEFLNKGGVGHVNGRIVDYKGNEIAEFNDRVIGVPLSTLKNAERSICVATGANKAEIVRAALKGGMITDLVADLSLAQQLV